MKNFRIQNTRAVRADAGVLTLLAMLLQMSLDYAAILSVLV